MNRFQDWLKKEQPLLSAATLPEHMALVRDGMALAWDAACEACARAQAPMLRSMVSRGQAADACRDQQTEGPAQGHAPE